MRSLGRNVKNTYSGLGTPTQQEQAEEAVRAGRSGLSKWEVGPIGAAAAEVVQSKEKKLTGCSGSGEATDQNRKVRWEVTEFGGVMFWIMFNRQLEFNIGELKGRLA